MSGRWFSLNGKEKEKLIPAKKGLSTPLKSKLGNAAQLNSLSIISLTFKAIYANKHI